MDSQPSSQPISLSRIILVPDFSTVAEMYSLASQMATLWISLEEVQRTIMPFSNSLATRSL